ncbi:cytochrome c-type biogenesis protein CcsB [Malonomonas rubra DSM 5091]|uniref:Cytochrome c-type biogenesis protein CcsB n=1 Tax=Malonomonas rubra DSM 5091 TaxID=1122189 RepID=A0A1M6LTB5_MALRU|nr:cytochrome c biogenesis protein CcsA [Malonomonas rubra]SHJ74356.1 cytochrome c-type biogenesis protein CcsB [Malonomonas rubra DSM 5091]
MMELQTSLLYAVFAAYCGAVLFYFVHLPLRRSWLWRTAFSLVLAGFALQTVCLALRWYSGGYLPVTNLFSTQFFFSWALAATYLYFELRYRIHAAGLFVIFCTLLLLGSVLQRSAEIPPLIPMLDTPLFTLHVSLSFGGYAFFAMAFSLGVLYLLQKRLQTGLLPDLLLLRKMNEEAVFLGFCLFTLCMIFGSIWAYVAWGYYFSWNIKGVWSALVWLFYAGMCHAKFIRRWQGSGYAALSIVGFGLVLFTYLGIGLLMSSNHPLD